jgi:hypothetical protein
MKPEIEMRLRSKRPSKGKWLLNPKTLKKVPHFDVGCQYAAFLLYYSTTLVGEAGMEGSEETRRALSLPWLQDLTDKGPNSIDGTAMFEGVLFLGNVGTPREDDAGRDAPSKHTLVVVDGPSLASRTSPWLKGETGCTVARVAEGADVLAVFVNAKDALAVLGELIAATKEFKHSSYVVYCVPNGGLTGSFLAPDEKATALLVFTETCINYVHEFERVDIVAAAKRGHPQNSLASGERSYSAPIYRCGCSNHGNSGRVCQSFADFSLRLLTNNMDTAGLPVNRDGSYQVVVLTPTYAGTVNTVRILQSITGEVEHSPHTSAQTVQAYFTDVVSIVHEEDFVIPEEHNMQLMVAPAVQKPPSKNKKAKKREEEEVEEEEEEEDKKSAKKDEEEEEAKPVTKATKDAKKRGNKNEEVKGKK